MYTTMSWAQIKRPCPLYSQDERDTGFKVHLCDELGCIVSDVPGVLRGIVFFNIRSPHPGDPARFDQVPACIPAATSQRCPLFNQSHCGLSDGAYGSALYCSIHSQLGQGFAQGVACKALTVHFDGVCVSATAGSSTPSQCLRIWPVSSHGPPLYVLPTALTSSHTMTFLVEAKVLTESGLSVVQMMYSGNLSWLPSSTLSCQSGDVESRFSLLCGRGPRRSFLVGICWTWWHCKPLQQLS